MKTKTIDIKDAKKWAKKWQKKNPQSAKAFLIPAVDLIDSLEEMEVIQKNPDGTYNIHGVKNAGVRAYLAIDDNQKSSHGDKLLIVGTKIDSSGVHRDIIEGEGDAALESGLEGSGVFDFTTPCPTACDDESPLN